MSMPIQGRFSCCAAAIVVPQPQNGTATGVKRDDQEFPEITEILVFSRLTGTVRVVDDGADPRKVAASQ